MRLLYLLPILLFFSLYCHAQNNEHAKVLSILLPHPYKANLEPKISDYIYNEICSRLTAKKFEKQVWYGNKLVIDPLIPTPAETAFIDSSLSAFYQRSWTREELDTLGLSAFNLSNQTDSYLFTTIPPIFLRDNTICFAYYEYKCGFLCGHGELVILKKENGEWQRWMYLITFDS